MYPKTANEERVLGLFLSPLSPLSPPSHIWPPTERERLAQDHYEKRLLLLFLFFPCSSSPPPLVFAFGLLCARLHPACKLSSIFIWRTELREGVRVNCWLDGTFMQENSRNRIQNLNMTVLGIPKWTFGYLKPYDKVTFQEILYKVAHPQPNLGWGKISEGHAKVDRRRISL